MIETRVPGPSQPCKNDEILSRSSSCGRATVCAHASSTWQRDLLTLFATCTMTAAPYSCPGSESRTVHTIWPAPHAQSVAKDEPSLCPVLCLTVTVNSSSPARGPGVSASLTTKAYTPGGIPLHRHWDNPDLGSINLDLCHVEQNSIFPLPQRSILMPLTYDFWPMKSLWLLHHCRDGPTERIIIGSKITTSRLRCGSSAS